MYTCDSWSWCTLRVNGSRKTDPTWLANTQHSIHDMDDCIIRATSASSAHGSGAWDVGWLASGPDDVPAAADTRWRHEQTSGQGYPENRAQHHRHHRIQVAGYGRLGTDIDRTSGENESDDTMATSAATNANDTTTTVTVFRVDDCVQETETRCVGRRTLLSVGSPGFLWWTLRYQQ